MTRRLPLSPRYLGHPPEVWLHTQEKTPTGSFCSWWSKAHLPDSLLVGGAIFSGCLTLATTPYFKKEAHPHHCLIGFFTPNLNRTNLSDHNKVIPTFHTLCREVEVGVGVNSVWHVPSLLLWISVSWHLAQCWAFREPLLNWVDLTSVLRGRSLGWREKAQRSGMWVVCEEIKDTFLLTTFQATNECLLYFCSPEYIHSFIQLLFARHYNWCWVSAVNKNSLCVCPEELCCLHSARWMTCHDLISYCRSMVSKPCLIMC